MSTFETPAFRDAFAELLAWRRDARSFLPDRLPETLLSELLAASALAPSVGLSQPWRFVRLESDAARAAVRSNFELCNAEALGGYGGEDAARYARLKLSGLDEAPVQLAVFSDVEPTRGRGLGRRTMPETLDYSAVMAIHTLWLVARTHGVGLGWVSILDPEALRGALDLPAAWRLIAVLCLGRPAVASDSPELERSGWEARAAVEIVQR